MKKISKTPYSDVFNNMNLAHSTNTIILDENSDIVDIVVVSSNTLFNNALSITQSPTGHTWSELNIPLTDSQKSTINNMLNNTCSLTMDFCIDSECYDSFMFLLTPTTFSIIFKNTLTDVEKAVAESEHRFRTLFEQTPNIAVQGYDHNRKVIFWNKASENMYGYTVEEALGKHLEELILPEHMWKKVADRVDAWLSTGEPTPAEELELLNKEGNIVPVYSNHIIQYDYYGIPELYCLDIDLSTLKQAEEQLRLTASVFEYAIEGIAITDKNGNILDVNASFCIMSKYTRAELIGKNMRILNAGKQDRDFYKHFWSSIKLQGSWFGELYNRRKNGDVFPALTSVSAVYNDKNDVLRYIAMYYDITTQKEKQKQLEHITYYDILTDLPNKLLFIERLTQAMSQATLRNEKIAIAFIDIDNFKVLNDTYGKTVGDQIIVAIANKIKLALRKGDVLSRLSGDEYGVLFNSISNTDTTLSFLIRQLLSTINMPTKIESNVIQVSASIGVTTFPQSYNISSDQLLRQADQAMYQAKVEGKNNFQMFDVETDKKIRSDFKHRHRISTGLTSNEFVMYYQPKVQLTTNSIVGAEALIRWEHPTKGLLPPGTFLPLVEGTPLIIEIGEWVIDTVLKQMNTWAKQHVVIPISLNVDSSHLIQADFMLKFQKTLQKYNCVLPHNVELEVLETSTFENLKHVADVFETGKLLGIKFSIDDFGTGYSSLSYLRQLPVNSIKIDRSFVKGMLDNENDLAIIEGVVGLANAFKRNIIAEGVETKAHIEKLIELGCTVGQGYALSYPLPADEFFRLITDEKSLPNC